MADLEGGVGEAVPNGDALERDVDRGEGGGGGRGGGASMRTMGGGGYNVVNIINAYVCVYLYVCIYAVEGLAHWMFLALSPSTVTQETHRRTFFLRASPQHWRHASA